ncbi:MAG TPA: DnaB-like helicase N-terminal domain-containing protein [Solirubrobacterales bacterium]|nr:DnaB-like helicase N-terminal domain-containing protein [Solirubrobacterales bacterium]
MSGSVLYAQEVDAEKAVLGAMLVNSAAVATVIGSVQLTVEEFAFDRNREVYASICGLHGRGVPIEEGLVVADLKDLGALDRAGGQHYVSELAATVPAAGNAKHYADIVRRRAIERRQGEVAADLLNGGDRAAAMEQLAALERASVAESSWKPVDLGDALAGRAESPPIILERSDGHALLYQGRLHQVAAEPEAGKSWFAVAAACEVIAVGGLVAYWDFEATAPEMVARLRSLGLSDESIRDRFIYVQPHEPIVPADLDDVLERSPALAIVDGVTEAMTIHGLSLNDNEDVAKWLETLPRPAMRSGAATVLVDHVVKDKEARNRYAIGAQHKLAGVHVAYSLEVVEPFGRGKQGVVRVKVQKDRPGHVRTLEVGGGGDVAMMRLSSDPATGRVAVDFDPPSDFGGGDGATFRPTRLMQRVSEGVEEEPGLTMSAIRRIKGKNGALDQAVKVLIEEGYIERRPEGQALRHYQLKPFTEPEPEAPW